MIAISELHNYLITIICFYICQTNTVNRIGILNFQVIHIRPFVKMINITNNIPLSERKKNTHTPLDSSCSFSILSPYIQNFSFLYSTNLAPLAFSEGCLEMLSSVIRKREILKGGMCEKINFHRESTINQNLIASRQGIVFLSLMLRIEKHFV